MDNIIFYSSKTVKAVKVEQPCRKKLKQQFMVSSQFYGPIWICLTIHGHARTCRPTSTMVTDRCCCCRALSLLFFPFLCSTYLLQHQWSHNFILTLTFPSADPSLPPLDAAQEKQLHMESSWKSKNNCGNLLVLKAIPMTFLFSQFTVVILHHVDADGFLHFSLLMWHWMNQYVCINEDSGGPCVILYLCVITERRYGHVVMACDSTRQKLKPASKLCLLRSCLTLNFGFLTLSGLTVHE